MCATEHLKRIMFQFLKTWKYIFKDVLLFFPLGFYFRREVQENEYKAVNSINDYYENEQYKNPLKYSSLTAFSAFKKETSEKNGIVNDCYDPFPIIAQVLLPQP